MRAATRAELSLLRLLLLLLLLFPRLPSKLAAEPASADWPTPLAGAISNPAHIYICNQLSNGINLNGQADTY